jgi:trans-aconitate methyltransferase
MSIKARMIDQFRQPRGPFGVLAGRFMARRSSNQQRSAWTVDLLDLQPGDRVLELGYGPGIGIEAVMRRLQSGVLVGVDHSEAMRKMALERVRDLDGQVRPVLRIGDAQALPDDIGTFDKIFSCNVWLFWQDPVAVFKQLRPHVAADGTLAVTHLPRGRQATRDTSLSAGATITAQLDEAGYGEMRQEVLELDPVPAVCVLAKTR